MTFNVKFEKSAVHNFSSRMWDYSEGQSFLQFCLYRIYFWPILSSKIVRFLKYCSINSNNFWFLLVLGVIAWLFVHDIFHVTTA